MIDLYQVERGSRDHGECRQPATLAAITHRKCGEALRIDVLTRRP